VTSGDPVAAAEEKKPPDSASDGLGWTKGVGAFIAIAVLIEAIALFVNNPYPIALEKLWPFIRDGVAVGAALVAVHRYTWSAKSRAEHDRQALIAQAEHDRQARHAQAEHDRRVRFGALHAKQLEVIGDVFQNVARDEDLFEFARDIQPAPAELIPRLQQWGRSANRTRRHFEEHRIWLDDATCARMDQLWQAVKEAGWAHADYINWWNDRDAYRLSDEEARKKLTACQSILTERVEPAKQALTKELRRVLAGDSPPENALM
jgi:hypothetical protein